MVTWSIFSCELRAPLDHLTLAVKPIPPQEKENTGLYGSMEGK
jgi:hypothetical protein